MPDMSTLPAWLGRLMRPLNRLKLRHVRAVAAWTLMIVAIVAGFISANLGSDMERQQMINPHHAYSAEFSWIMWLSLVGSSQER